MQYFNDDFCQMMTCEIFMPSKNMKIINSFHHISPFFPIISKADVVPFLKALPFPLL